MVVTDTHPLELWAATFQSHAQLILHEFGKYLGYSAPPWLKRLIEEAEKIHQPRPILRETLATATQPRCESELKKNAWVIFIKPPNMD